MQADNGSSHVASTQKVPNPGRFLIPRSQRRRFLIQFTFMTCLGWVVGGVASIALEKILYNFLLVLSQDPQMWNTLASYFSSFVFAAIFAADQALVLRRYLSGWLWMLATSVGWLIANTVSTAWISYISGVASSLNDSLTSDAMIILGFMSTVAYIISGVWLGLCQWLVLRRYTVGAWWWNFLPTICFFFISLLVGLLSLLQNFIPEAYRSSIWYFNEQGFTAFILGIIPAIGLCNLKRNLHHTTRISSSS
ncbi:MAG: hypothetical protein KME32_06845 [Mojavia pulchra JT2-VF2]|jgi:hypothetical protein|uniref:Uncharacterized protein n=1 Tax=Mojavia pulchra JT2-VF2 TaxID=287848 RepID=A0A951UET9_9NOST|nr:hypothetical protein [Mojavia pulchra JT2-VF2]